MEAIIIGTSLSGKTTLISYLRAHSALNLSEMDEVLTELNNGVYPQNLKYKNEILVPKAITEVLAKKDIVFFTNTNYFSPNDLTKARKLGFKIIQLVINLNELNKRNTLRVNKEGYDDLTQYLQGMTQYQQDINKQGFVDKRIDANQPIEIVAKELLDYLSRF